MRQLSVAAARSLFAQETDLVWLCVLTIDHASMSTIRVVNNLTDVISRGNTFLAFPFYVALPNESDSAPPRVRLTIDNVDRKIVEAVRGLTGPPILTLEIITNADPNYVEIGPLEFKMYDAEFDDMVVSGDLTYEPVLNEPYPAGSFTPADFPGLF